jgi:carbon monoxide dehydrogenase subunit G
MPSVDFTRTVTVPASPEAAWSTVTDVDRVAGWVTVVGSVDEIEPLSRYSAVLADRLGPFKLSADLDVSVIDMEAPRSIAFLADGEDRQVASRIKIEAALTISPLTAGCQIDVTGRYEVTGRVANLGASMIRAKGEKILDEFVSKVETEVR